MKPQIFAELANYRRRMLPFMLREASSGKFSGRLAQCFEERQKSHSCEAYRVTIHMSDARRMHMVVMLSSLRCISRLLTLEGGSSRNSDVRDCSKNHMAPRKQ